jgi:hypothetical protein
MFKILLSKVSVIKRGNIQLTRANEKVRNPAPAPESARGSVVGPHFRVLFLLETLRQFGVRLDSQSVGNCEAVMLSEPPIFGPEGLQIDHISSISRQQIA